MALHVAGNVLVAGNMPERKLYANSKPTLGLRSLREEFLQAEHRKVIARNLQHIEQRAIELQRDERPELAARRLPRFQHLYAGGEWLPPAIFIAALELGPTEKLCGRALAYDADVLVFRDDLVAAYKPLVWKIRQLISKEISELPARLVLDMTGAWDVWEAAWLRNREVHAVEALQPLARAILSLEPLLLSCHKERLQPWPRVQHQQVVTLRCLEGFMHALGDLAANVLPSPQRELDRDPRLLMLMDHVLQLRGSMPVESCLAGLSKTPGVAFPGLQPPGSSPPMPPTSTKSLPLKGELKGMTLDAYAFRLLGASVGDALAQRAVTNGGNPNSPGAARSQSTGATMGRRTPASPPLMPTESVLSQNAVSHAIELLASFEDVKDLLLSLKSTLEYVDPRLERDEQLGRRLCRFERAYRRAKRLFLEPDNLA
eukprot:NODE_6999_length_1618_cov_4.753856.p1 GENE.NODE_6999_length_1618_cov_4.753856~~NODE_6999_length_1618_cov_4.753856.p1  ORF type:complete len:440 (-),score=135.45 NODE_6999_length_1618_cov_4.753856:297-1586(-)